MSMTKEEAIAELRKTLKPGRKVTCVLRHCARSGMCRWIDLYYIDGKGERQWLSYQAALAGVGDSFDKKRECIRVSGCGMDMGFALVYNLNCILYPKGFGCIGEKCSSNDHSNGDRNRAKHTKKAPHWHNSGGYALRHEWL